jgi:cell division protein ZapE
MPDGPMSRYRALVAEGTLQPDPGQALAVETLQLLHQRLIGYSPAKGKRSTRGLLGFARKAPREEPPPRGLYLYGGVGRGKSMLMDVFYETAPLAARRRVHFHAFMQEVHAGIHFARQNGTDDPVPPVVDEIAEGATLLCFDELQVTDITDAMILGRLFEGLFKRGVIVVATSNRHPDELYKNGLNRQLFLPFIAMLKQRLDLHELESPTDFRRRAFTGHNVYHTPLGHRAEVAMADAWAELTGGATGAPLTLAVQGRTLTIPRFAEGVARASFADLCTKPLGAADYLALTAAAHTVLIDGIPMLSRARNNEAKRFVTLIDTLYEACTRLICSAEAEPEQLYTEGEGAFEFARTASRLAEMRRHDWPQARTIRPQKAAG